MRIQAPPPLEPGRGGYVEPMTDRQLRRIEAGLIVSACVGATLVLATSASARRMAWFAVRTVAFSWAPSWVFAQVREAWRDSAASPASGASPRAPDPEPEH